MLQIDFCFAARTLGLRAILSCLSVRENLFDQGNASREESARHWQDSLLLHLSSFSMSICEKEYRNLVNTKVEQQRFRVEVKTKNYSDYLIFENRHIFDCSGMPTVAAAIILNMFGYKISLEAVLQRAAGHLKIFTTKKISTMVDSNGRTETDWEKCMEHTIAPSLLIGGERCRLWKCWKSRDICRSKKENINNEIIE